MLCCRAGRVVQAGMIVISFELGLLVSLSSLPRLSSLVVSRHALRLSSLVSSCRTWQALRLVMASGRFKRMFQASVCFSVHADGVHASTVQANRGRGSRARVATQIAIESPPPKKMRKGA